MKYLSNTFYKYFDLEPSQDNREYFLDLMKKHELKGKIIISKEGINGAICGLKDNVNDFLEELRTYPGVEDLTWRETVSESQCYKRTLVKIREELVPLGVGGVTPITKGGGKALKPEELKKWYDKGEDFVILDARNDYEYEVGKFKGALEPNVEKFRDFKERVEELEDYKDKKIVTYCTGGIRCEKASAYMKSKGFKDVYKLDGGIIEFLKLEDSDKYWDGKLFVFDKRWEISSKETKVQN